jgi:hypothetical protein
MYMWEQRIHTCAAAAGGGGALMMRRARHVLATAPQSCCNPWQVPARGCPGEHAVHGAVPGHADGPGVPPGAAASMRQGLRGPCTTARLLSENGAVVASSVGVEIAALPYLQM